MKKIQFGMLMLAVLLTGCKAELAEPAVNGGAELSATFAKEETRVYLGEDYYFRWEKGDLLSTFLYNQSHRKYEAREGDVIETLLDEVEIVTNVSEGTDGYNYAIFPYSDANAYDSGKLIATLPSAQSYDKDRVNLNSAVMVARIPSSESMFYFKNSCALLKLNVTKTDAFIAKLKSITVTSAAHKLAGRVVVDAANEDYTAVIDANDKSASNSITFTGCEEAGILSGNPLTFFIAIPAGTYEANDLTVTFDCDVDQLDCSKTIPTAYTVGRSKYLDLSTTLGEDGGWYEETPGGVNIDDATLTNRAIMTNIPRLLKNGWADQENVESVFEVPENDNFTITGKDLVQTGDAVDGEPPVITHVMTDENAYIINTFTTNRSGIAGVTPPTVTVENLTITGELRTNSLGEYVSNAVTAPEKSSQYNFSTVLNKVNIVDCKILPYNTNDKRVGAAVCVNGTAVLNDCVVKGTVKSELADRNPSYEGVSYYDMACANCTHTFINGGEVGSIFGWEQSDFTFDKGAVINSLYTLGIYASNVDGHVTVSNATVNEMTFNPAGTYPPYLTLNSEAKVGTLRFIDAPETFAKAGYWDHVVVAAGAQVNKVIVGEDGMTLEEFVSTYKK